MNNMKKYIIIILLLATIASTAQIQQWQIEAVDTTDIERTNWLEFLLNNGGTGFTNADETDPVFSASDAFGITSADISNLSNLSGINTGDQVIPSGNQIIDWTLSGQGTIHATNYVDNNTQLTDGEIAAYGYIKSFTETDPVFTASDAFGITSSDISTWDNSVSQTITNGVTTSAPSEDAVYDALALKANLSGANTFDTAPSSTAATSYSQIPTLGQVMDSINNVGGGVAIGDFYQGGIVYWIDPSGTYGYCAYPTPIPQAVWSPTEGVLLGASGTAIGTGSTNTSTITAYHGSGDYGAYNCSNLTANGYSDWVLPAIDGVSEIYTELHATGILTFPETDYMSSTETLSTNYRGVAFATGVVGSYGKLPFERGVIPVRMFTVDPPTEAPLPVGDTGDLLYSVSGGDDSWSGLAVGANGTVLKSNGTIPVYSVDLQGVTSVSNGNGMSFTTITSTGSVSMGIPSQITESSLNGFPTSSHSHSFDMSTFELDDLGDVPTPIANYYLRRNAANDGYDFVSTAGSSYVLPTASDSEKGGVKTSTTGGTQMIGEFIVQNDSRLNTTTPLPTDILGYWDVSDGAQRKTTYKALLNALGTPVDLDGTTNTLDLSTYVNGTITVSGNETITFTNMASGQTGNIEVNQTGTGSLSFTASGYTIKLHPSIYLSAGTTKSVATGETPTYSYWVVGSVIKINGTQSYQ